jgi:hypothetical protein
MLCPDTTPCTTGLPLLNDPAYPGYDSSLYKCAMDVTNGVDTPRSCVDAKTLSPTDWSNIVVNQYYNDASGTGGNCSVSNTCSGLVQASCF